MIGSFKLGATAPAAFVALVAIAAASGCKGGGAASPDGSADGLQERPVLLCSSLDAGTEDEDAATWPPGSDQFGPNAPAAKTASSLGRVNIYEATTASLLERVDVYLRADLGHTRLTIAVQEAPSRVLPFHKLADVQIDMPACEGWASSGPVMIPLEAGRFYAIGVDPNQAVIAFVNADGDSLPIDGVFGRLIGSKAATSVSVPTITWEKFSDKEYNRQRLVTSARDGGAPPNDAATPGDAAAGADSGDAAPADAARDGGTTG